MAKKRTSLGDAFMGLPWLLRLIIVIFLDFIMGIIRLIDGIIEGNILKVILGLLWIAYGLVIGWILDIVFTLLNKRPLLF